MHPSLGWIACLCVLRGNLSRSVFASMNTYKNFVSIHELKCTIFMGTKNFSVHTSSSSWLHFWI